MMVEAVRIADGLGLGRKCGCLLAGVVGPRLGHVGGGRDLMRSAGWVKMLLRR
jgi:hypothetical protein